MSFEELMQNLVPVTFVLYLLLERVAPARPQPKVRGWLFKGVVFFGIAGTLATVVPMAILSAAGGATLLDLSGLGMVGGAALLLVAGDLLGYWIHRGLHAHPLVWRFTHQLHHSAERMDMAGSSYFHPLDFVLQTPLPAAALGLVFGVTPEAAALGGFLGFALGVFPHLNMRTPAWLGYVLQRPEMHAVHHLRGVHAHNYGNLAFSDLLFGTWQNPAEFPMGEFGFWDGASSRLGGLLLGQDLSTPPAEARDDGARAAA